MTKAILAVVVVQLVVLVAIAAILRSGVTVANQVETVTVANPVETVKVSEITSVVQVAVPAEADLYGFCRLGGGGYVLSITAVTGGIAQTVAEGTFTPNAASAIGVYASQYYQNSQALDFGHQSEGVLPSGRLALRTAIPRTFGRGALAGRPEGRPTTQRPHQAVPRSFPERPACRLA